MSAAPRGAMDAMDLGLPQVDVSVGIVTYPPGGTLGPRAQLDLQLVLIHEGSATIDVDGTAQAIAAGEAALLLPGHTERFAFDPESPTTHSWVQARLPAGERFERLPKAIPISPGLDLLVREAVATTTAERGHLVAAALLRYAAEAERERPRLSRPVDDARRHIAANLHDPKLTLADVARAAHVTPAHLVRSFRAAHGTTPMAHLWERRVALAADLLANTGLPIAAVAERCGFKTVHHFSRRVRDGTGLPPGALRRASWEARR
jgi:AraC-like DNA-binding protein